MGNGKDLKYSLLLDYYSAMLTDKQADAMDLYYNEDLSLAEIAESAGTTRQAVMNCIRKSEQNLKDIEKKMQLCQRSKRAGEIIEKLAGIIKNDSRAGKLLDELRELI